MAGRDVRLIAVLIDVGFYVLVGVIGGLLSSWLGWGLWRLLVAAQAVLLVKRGQTLGDKVIHWVVVALLLAVVIGGAAMIGNGAMSI